MRSDSVTFDYEPAEFHLVHNYNENCHCNHIPFNCKGIVNQYPGERLENYKLQSGSYCWELFGAMEDIKIHRVSDPQYPQDNRVSKLIARQIRKVLYQAKYA